MKFEDLKGEDRLLAFAALQSLHRERLKTSSEAHMFYLSGKTPPPDDVYGLHEVQDALKRIAASPK